MSEFSNRVLAWGGRHGRKDLPWQCSKDPYKIWVSEIMLQQTQVQTVIPYFERFMQRFPTLQKLANASTDDVLKHWSGLGYYARARNLHKSAKIICDEHNSRFPCTFDDVVALPGIGRSTAGAILSLAFEQRHAILDGNVKRVLARHASIKGWPGQIDVQSRLWSLAERYTPDHRVGDYTQAIMDLGATVCTRTTPECASCPVHSDCAALAAGNVEDFPGRKPKKAKPLRQTTMVLALLENKIYLERRPPAGIWGGLWSLPELADDDLEDWCEHLTGGQRLAQETLQSLRHSFSHFDLQINPVLIRLNSTRPTVADDDDAVWYRLGASPPGGIAAPVQKLIDSVSDSLRTLDNVANH